MSVICDVSPSCPVRVFDLEMHRAWHHEVAAVAEGICPVHGWSLEPVQMSGGEIAGHCAGCGRYWWFDRATLEVGWCLDHNPFTGTWRPPWRPE